jgi:hypothetical protein
MSDYSLPELPSDEELGIAGIPEDDSDDPDSPAPPPPPTDEEPGGAPPPSRGPAWRGPLTLALLLVTAWATGNGRALPRPAPANAPDTAFSSARAISTIADIARSPRPPGSPEHARVRELLLSRLGEMGFETEVQSRTGVRAADEEAVAVTVHNVVARREGSASTGALLLVAHYDSHPLTPGAGDDATGVAAILEVLRSLQSELPLRNDLVILFSDGEETGLHGARAFATSHRWMQDVRVVLNVEMRGSGGPSLMFQTGEDNGWIVDQMAAADPSPVANSIFVDIYRRLPNDTDFTVFLDAGVQGLNFAAIGRPENYHQPTDTPANLQEATVQHHGIRLLALTRRLGAADLTSVDAPDRSFLRLPVLGLMVLPLGLAWPLTVAVIGGLLLATFLATLRGARSRGVTLGAILSLIAMAASALGAWAMVRWTAPFHEEYGTLLHAFWDEGPYRVASGALAFALTVGLFEGARRWVRPLEATLGALLVPVLTLLGVTLVARGGALNLQLALGGIVALVLVLAVTGLHRSQGWVAWALTLVFVLPVLVLLYPLMELMAVALGMGAAPFLGALWVLLLLFLIPALEWLDRPNRWWAALTGIGVAAVALSVGVLRADPAPERPSPSTLIYAMSRDSDGLPVWARWVTTDREGALIWAESATEGTFVADSAALLDGFQLPERTFLIEEAPLAALPPPRIVVLRDTVIGGQRRVRLGILSRVGAESIRITAPDGVSFQGVAGTPEDAADMEALSPSVRSLVHLGATEPDLTVALAGSATGPWEMTVEESLYRPQEVFPGERFRRPPDLIPDIRTGSDRILVRTPYRVGSRVLAGGWAGPGALSTQPSDTARVGAPQDSLAVDSLAGDTLATDTLVVDSGGVSDTLAPGSTATPDSLLAPDSLQVDSLPPDSTAADTIGVDTTAVDTMGVDTVGVDTDPTDSVRADTLLIPARAGGDGRPLPWTRSR